MMFDYDTTWDTLSIQLVIYDHLEDNKWIVSTSMGFSNEGQSAFINTARKNRNLIIITLENNVKQIRIQAGIDGKYLPEGKKEPKYSKTFPHTQIKQASDFFEKILEELS